LLQQVLAGKLPAVSLSATRERMLKEALEQIQSGNVKQHQSVETLIGESLYRYLSNLAQNHPAMLAAGCSLGRQMDLQAQMFSSAHNTTTCFFPLVLGTGVGSKNTGVGSKKYWSWK